MTKQEICDASLQYKSDKSEASQILMRSYLNHAGTSQWHNRNIRPTVKT